MALLFKNSLVSLLDDVILVSVRILIIVSSFTSKFGTPLKASSISISVKSLILPVNNDSDIF